MQQNNFPMTGLNQVRADFSDDNYYRIILETVHHYPKTTLNTMTDEECEAEHEVISNDGFKLAK